MGSNPPNETPDFFGIVCLHKNAGPTHSILHFLQENVKNGSLISHFASASRGLQHPDPLPWVLPLDSTGGLPSPSTPVRHHFGNIL